MIKLIRLTTVGLTQNILLKNQLLFLDKHFELIAASHPDEHFIKLGNETELNLKRIGFSRDISLVQDLKSLFTLIKYFRKERPDIIHSNTPKSSLLSMIAGKIVGVKHRIYTVTGLRYSNETGKKRKLLMTMEKLTCKFATRVIAEGAGVQKVLVADDICHDSVVIGNGSLIGVDTSKKFNPGNLKIEKIAQIKNDISYDKKNKYFLAIGRVVKDKGIIEIVDVFTKFNKENPDTRLILLGQLEQDLDPLPKVTLESIKSNESIIQIDWSDYVEYFLHLADALIHASYREGFPNVLLQAGAMGCPIICTDIPGNNDIVDDKSGTLFQKGSKEELKEIMSDFIKDDSSYIMKSNNLKETIRNLYSQDYLHKKLIEFYEAL